MPITDEPKVSSTVVIRYGGDLEVKSDNPNVQVVKEGG